MRPLAGGPLRRARSGRRLAGAKLKYTDMNSKYALPKDGGLIVDSAPSDIIRRYERFPPRSSNTNPKAWGMSPI